MNPDHLRDALQRITTQLDQVPVPPLLTYDPNTYLLTLKAPGHTFTYPLDDAHEERIHLALLLHITSRGWMPQPLLPEENQPPGYEILIPTAPARRMARGRTPVEALLNAYAEMLEYYLDAAFEIEHDFERGVTTIQHVGLPGDHGETVHMTPEAFGQLLALASAGADDEEADPA